ncbi:MAG: type I 3-dehydroquinate dehydratase [Lachnospiraceae bacterium]|nr:type I 3-dehydroquinate dehydratase [Lachnospiraceae bacterium]
MSGEIKRSKICVPIVAVDEIEIIRQLEKIKDKKKTAQIDMAEFRADYYKDLNDFKKLDKLLMDIRNELNKEGIKLLFTIRSKAEGGEELDFEKPTVNEINLHIAENKLADMIDIEYYSEKNSADRVMSEAKKNNIKIILSSHDFEKTPSLDEMLERYKGMQERKADIIKLAVMPHSEQDVSNLLKAVLSTYEKYSDVKVVGISMGELGRRTRIEGYRYGSYMTFAIIDKASAPGQVSVDELN